MPRLFPFAGVSRKSRLADRTRTTGTDVSSIAPDAGEFRPFLKPESTSGRRVFSARRALITGGRSIMLRHHLMNTNTASRIEPLETRIAPASLILTEGGLVFLAGNNVANNITFSIVGGNIVITDSAETISVAGAAGFVLSNGNKTATGPDSSVSNIAFNTGNGTDTILVLGTNDQTSIFGSGTQTVNIGNGSVKNIRNLISVDGTPGADTLTVDASTDAAAATLTVSAGGISGTAGDSFFGANGQLLPSGIESITVKTGLGTDTVRVQGTAGGTTTDITSAGGTDNVTVGLAGDMQGIAGALSIAATGTVVNLTLNDSADATARTATITNAQVTGLAPAAISFAEGKIGSFTVLGGTGDDVFTISSVQAAGGTNVNVIDAGGGNDQITLASAGAAGTLRGSGGDDQITVGTGSLDSIIGAIIVEGGGQAGDSLVLNDSVSPFSDTFTITSTMINRVVFGSVTFSGVGGVTLNAQSGANAVNIVSTAAGVPLTLNSGAGFDTITLGSGSGNLDNILAPIILDGGTNTDTLTLNDSLSTAAHTYTVTGTTFSRDGLILITSAANVEIITLLAGSGGDTLDARNATTPLTLNAGGGDDLVLGSPFADTLIGSPGLDTYAGFGITGDAIVTDAGITSAALGNDIFSGGLFEVVKITGGPAANVLDATAYTGFAMLDGLGGTDTVTGSEVLFTPKSVVFTDLDGDTVTLKTTKGRIGPANLQFRPGLGGTPAQLAGIDLLGDTAFKGATITLTAKPKAGLGDSFANVGLIDATGLDLASVIIPGDLGRILVGDATLTTPGLGKLAVQSLGAFGLATQGGTGSTENTITGKLTALAVKGSVRSVVSASDFGPITIGGNMDRVIESGKNIPSLTIRGSVANGIIFAEGTIGVLKIGGSLTGTIAAGLSSTLAPTTQAASVVIKSLIVGGDVRNAAILAGSSTLFGTFNADVSIGTITVSGDWVQSNVSAGVSVLVGVTGVPFDTLGIGQGGAFNGVAGGNPAILARIAAITIKGQVSGTSPAPGGIADHFSFIAQQIGSFKIGTAKLPLTPALNTPIPLGITGGDVTVREVA